MAKTCILFRLLYKVFLRNFNRATHLSISFIFPSHTLLFCPLSLHPYNLHPISTYSTAPFLSLWVCGIVSQLSTKPISFSFFLYNPHSVPWGWLRPGFIQKTGHGGGTGLLISNNWKYSTHSPLCNHNSFESHVIIVTASTKLHIVIISRPPGQILGTFLEELDGLLSSFMEDGTPLLVFGNFNNHLDKPYATDVHSRLASFNLERLTTTSTENQATNLI